MLTALKYSRKLSAFDHGIFFYHTIEEKRQVLFNFLKEGLDNQKGAVYVAGEESPRTIRKAMLNFGIDVKNLEREGLLTIVNYDKWYIVNGKVEIPKIVGLWEKACDKAEEKGLRGLHVCGEMDCFFPA